VAQTPAQAPGSLGNLISYIEGTSEVLEKAAQMEQVEEDRVKEAETLIPGIVDDLSAITLTTEKGVVVPLLEQDEKQACAAALRDPKQAIHVLAKVARYYKTEVAANRLGRAAPTEKKAHVGSTPYTGRRSGGEGAAEAKFRQAILGS
jgi:hypothetical protein